MNINVTIKPSKLLSFCAVYRYKIALYEKNIFISCSKDQLCFTNGKSVRTYHTLSDETH